MDDAVVCRSCNNTGKHFMTGKPCGCQRLLSDVKVLPPVKLPEKCLLCTEPLLDDGRCIVCDADPDTAAQ